MRRGRGTQVSLQLVRRFRMQPFSYIRVELPGGVEYTHHSVPTIKIPGNASPKKLRTPRKSIASRMFQPSHVLFLMWCGEKAVNKPRSKKASQYIMDKARGDPSRPSRVWCTRMMLSMTLIGDRMIRTSVDKRMIPITHLKLIKYWLFTKNWHFAMNHTLTLKVFLQTLECNVSRRAKY